MTEIAKMALPIDNFSDRGVEKARAELVRELEETQTDPEDHNSELMIAKHLRVSLERSKVGEKEREHERQRFKLTRAPRYGDPIAQNSLLFAICGVINSTTLALSEQ